MRMRCDFVAAVVALGLLAACGREAAPGSRAVTAPPVTLPAVRNPIVYVIYYPGASAGALGELDKALAQQHRANAWQRVGNGAKGDGLFADMAATSEYPPPDLEALKYFGRGLSNEDARAVQGAKMELGLVFNRDWARDYGYLHSAEQIAYDVAQRTHGLLWDDAARLLYTPAEYKKLVLDNWRDDLPSVRREVAIHEYAEGGRMRAVTLGMEKFGLPNMVVNGFSRSSAGPMGSLMTLCGQTMVETRPAVPTADVAVDLEQVRQKDVREWILPTLEDGATKRGTLHLVAAKREEGDADTPLYEISFNAEKGASPTERQEALISRMFGAHDEMQGVKHDAEMLALVAKEQAKLQALKPHFEAGLAPGERLEVQSRFEQDGQAEWMWVEVQTWKGDTITGTLQNDPEIVNTLKAGAPVTVQASEAFDYIFTHSDRTREGNETATLIEKRGH